MKSRTRSRWWVVLLLPAMVELIFTYQLSLSLAYMSTRRDCGGEAGVADRWRRACVGQVEEGGSTDDFRVQMWGTAARRGAASGGQRFGAS